MRQLSILETVLYVDDIVGAEAFYTRLLGIAPQLNNPQRFVFYRLGQQMLLLFDHRKTTAAENAAVGLLVDTHGGPCPGHVCFRVEEDELDARRAGLLEQGIAVEHEHVWPQGGRSIYFRDPAGNSLEFGTPQLWGLASS